MSLLGRLRISYAVALAVLVPIVAALFFAANLVARDNDTVEGLENLTQLVELSVRMSDLVHAQQFAAPIGSNNRPIQSGNGRLVLVLSSHN